MSRVARLDRSHPWSASDDAPAILFDETGKVSWVNDAFTAMTGWPAEACLAQSLSGLRQRLGLALDRSAIREVLASGRTWQSSLELRARDGSTGRIDVRVDLLHDREGRIVGAMAVARPA